MQLRALTARRLIGTAAIACAAALIPVAALAATGTAPAAKASTPACATSGLVVWINTQRLAPLPAYNLEFTNLSGHACTLHGTPGVSAVSLSGRQIGRPANGNYAHTAKVPAVRLASGATAIALLSIVPEQSHPGQPCRPVTAAGLRVYPPDQTASKVIPYPFRACSATARFMYAGVVQKN